MMKTIAILQVGLGPLGIKMYEMTTQRRSEKVVGAVDIRPELEGQDVGVLAGMDKCGIFVKSTIKEACEHHTPDIAVVTTVSDLKRIVPTLLELIELEIPIVTTCEELSYAWDESPELSSMIDKAAKRNNVAVLGTGVNPGFLMDSLPSMLTAVCSRVDKVEVDRYQDAQYRRVPFQLKIGAGLTLEQFEQKKADGSLRHVGLTESMQFIAYQLGWNLDRTEDIIEPVIADDRIDTPAMTIEAGMASGVRQLGKGYVDGIERIRLTFQAAVGEPESYDEVRIIGEPDVISRIKNGVNGDIATCAITLNAAHSVLAAPRGLRTMADIPMVSGKA